MQIRIIAGKSDSGTNQVIDLSQLQNSSLSMLGASGSGKTTKIRDFCYQAAEQGAQVVIFDASGDWQGGLLYNPYGVAAPNTVAVSNQVIRRINVRGDGLSFNPLQQRILPSGNLETFPIVGARIADQMTRAYGPAKAQSLHLSMAVCGYMKSCIGPYSIGGLLYYIYSLGDKMVNKMMVSVERLMHLCGTVNCGIHNVMPEFNYPGITILDFCDVPDQGTQALLTELLVMEILDTRTMMRSEQRVPLILVFDEAQRFRFDADSALVRLLREGRRFGVSGWFSTQYLKKSADADALGNAAIQIQFRPVDTQVRAAARTMSHGDKALEKRLLEELPRLGRGQFFFRDGNGVLRKVARAAG